MRTSYIQPHAIIGRIHYSVKKHHKPAKTLYERNSEMKQETAEIAHLTAFLNMLDALFEEAHALRSPLITLAALFSLDF